MARYTLLLGSIIGQFVRNIFDSFAAMLDRHEQLQMPISLPLVVLLLVCSCVSLVTADCNSQSIIQSELRTCEKLALDSSSCNLFTNAEVTLPNINAESCLYFQDKEGEHLFSIKIRLDEVTCSFNTKRQYFTFPVMPKHISQISCIFNKYCGQGVHCVQGTSDPYGLRFEAETPESRDFPGISACTAGSLGVGCTILTRAACNFFRTWYEPDLLHSYEVSTITGHQCQYHISITQIENNTVSRISLTDSAYTNKGIKVSLIGAYDQPQLHLNDYFIQRVGRPEEAYLAPASKQNLPRAGEIGAVQANSSYTKFFIFDPALTTCDFFEDTLRCQTAQDQVVNLRHSKEYLLPLQKDLHLFRSHDSKLVSTLLVSAAVRLQLTFQNFKIVVESKTVCPMFHGETIRTQGCYKCGLFAKLTVSIFSSCQPGVVTVELQTIKVHTKAITIATSPNEIDIKFLAEEKCIQDKLCVVSQRTRQCIELNFCLDEPSVDLLSLNMNYTLLGSVPTSTSWFDWLKLPAMDTSLFLLKFLGSSLFLESITITIISTLISCCCRHH